MKCLHIILVMFPCLTTACRLVGDKKEKKEKKELSNRETSDLDSKENFTALALAELDSLLKEKEELRVLPERVENEDVFTKLTESLAAAFKKMDQKNVQSRRESAVALLDSDKNGKISEEETASGFTNILRKFQEFAPNYRDQINKQIPSESFRCFFVNGKMKDSASEEIHAIIHKSSIAKCGFPEVLAPSQPFEKDAFCAIVLDKKSKNEILKSQRADMLWGLGPLPDASCNEEIRPIPEGPKSGGYEINDCAPGRIRLALRYRFVKMCEIGQENPGSNTAPTGATLESLSEEIKKLVEGPQRCDTTDDCKSVNLGYKACGGPSSHIYYAVKSVDVKTLLNKVAEYTELEKKHVEEQGLGSTCNIIEPQTQSCSDKICKRDSPHA